MGIGAERRASARDPKKNGATRNLKLSQQNLPAIVPFIERDEKGTGKREVLNGGGGNKKKVKTVEGLQQNQSGIKDPWESCPRRGEKKVGPTSLKGS